MFLVSMCIILIFAFIKLKGISLLCKFLLYFFVCTMLHEGFIIIEKNLGLIERDKVVFKWLTLVFYGIALNPVLISFFTILILKTQFKISKKVLFFTGLVLFLTCMEGFWKYLGYVHYIHWNLFYTSIRYSSVIIFSLIFFIWLEKKVIRL
jgi:hypothetical protein